MSEKIPFLPIEDLTPRYILTSMSEGERQDWGMGVIGVSEAHKITKGAGIVVAVLDTGAPNHRDVLANLLPGMNVTSSPSGADSNGHSTHLSGIIAAAENGFGVIGVAPEAKILPIKVLDDHGESGFDTICAGVRAAIDAHVDIISMSLGSAATPPQELHDVIIEAAAKGIIVVASAGNDSGAVNYPARYPEVIAVGAVDQNGNLAAFSSRDEHIAVVAPGVAIYSDYINQTYALLNGTSQAAPYVSGICALLLSWSRSNPLVPQIRNISDMLQALDDISDPAGIVGYHGKSGDYGFGVPHFMNDFPSRIHTFAPVTVNVTINVNQAAPPESK